MSPKRYDFYTIFDYNITTGVLLPKFDVIVDNKRYPKNIIIPRYTNFGGLNLFNYIGKDIAGYWNEGRKEMTIVGFY